MLGRGGRLKDKAIGGRLSAARRAAGFKTAALAVAANGWSLRRLQSHESGHRGVLPYEMTQYAAAYDVDLAWLTTGEGLGPDMARKREPAELAGFRLAYARTARGYAVSRAAAKAFGWTPQTYQSHEAGGALLNRWWEVYALAYDVEARWIQFGDLPSGLGDEADRALSGINLDDPALEERLQVLLDRAPKVPLATSTRKLAAEKRAEIQAMAPVQTRRPAPTEITIWHLSKPVLRPYVLDPGAVPKGRRFALTFSASWLESVLGPDYPTTVLVEVERSEVGEAPHGAKAFVGPVGIIEPTGIYLAEDDEGKSIVRFGHALSAPTEAWGRVLAILRNFR